MKIFNIVKKLKYLIDLKCLFKKFILLIFLIIFKKEIIIYKILEFSIYI